MATQWDANSESFPTFSELPEIPGAPKGAAWFWGKDDNLGRVNLLTPKRVKRAAQEIETGEIISLNLPLDVPKVPGFGRDAFEHTIESKGGGIVFDDHYKLNTQSGTQWDGFRHFGHRGAKQFYNGATAADVQGPQANEKLAISHISNHGIAGRGILIDFASYAETNDIKYDAFTRFELSLASLFACARSQGINPLPQARGGDVRPGDMLFIRIGWTKRYYELAPDERKRAAKRENQEWAGVSQSREMLEWLHDCYFATVAGDMPAFEAWPTSTEYFLHEYLLAMWGVPIGEMLDLERLSIQCRKLNKWSFFVSSAPANCPRGVASHVNGLAIL